MEPRPPTFIGQMLVRRDCDTQIEQSVTLKEQSITQKIAT